MGGPRGEGGDQGREAPQDHAESHGCRGRGYPHGTIQGIAGVQVEQRGGHGHDVQVIHAEGEQRSVVALKAAADMLHSSPISLKLRYLQVSTWHGWSG